MPRRVYTYGADMGFSGTNMVITVGAFLFALGIALFFVEILRARVSGRAAGPNPWDGPTLEWSVTFAAAGLQFRGDPAGRLAAIRCGRTRIGEVDEGSRSLFAEGFLLDKGKETLAVTPLDGEPDVILKMPGDSWLPVLLSLALFVLFAGTLLLSPWIGGGGLLAAARDTRAVVPAASGTRERGGGRVYG